MYYFSKAIEPPQQRQLDCDCENWPLCHTLMNFSFSSRGALFSKTHLLQPYTTSVTQEEVSNASCRRVPPKGIAISHLEFFNSQTQFCSGRSSQVKSIRNCNRPESFKTVIKIQFNSKDNEIVVGSSEKRRDPFAAVYSKKPIHFCLTLNCFFMVISTSN